MFSIHQIRLLGQRTKVSFLDQGHFHSAEQTVFLSLKKNVLIEKFIYYLSLKIIKKKQSVGSEGSNVNQKSDTRFVLLMQMDYFFKKLLES